MLGGRAYAEFGGQAQKCLNSVIHTGGGTRTLTPLRETDFESVASANSATPAEVWHHP